MDRRPSQRRLLYGSRHIPELGILAPAGFKVELYATNLDEPREIRTAPNGDLFVAETHLGQIKIFRGRDKDGKPQQVSVFATGLNQPFGIAFYPRGANHCRTTIDFTVN